MTKEQKATYRQNLKRAFLTASICTSIMAMCYQPAQAYDKPRDGVPFVTSGPGIPKSGGTFLIRESADGRIKVYEKFFMDMSGLQEARQNDEATVTSAERLVDGGMIVYGTDGSVTYHAPDGQ